MRILYLDLDTLRPDHLGCYGYERDTSPNIDRIAQRAVRFNNYYCSDAPCLPSRTALMTGRFGIHTGVVNHGGTNADIRREGPERQFRDRLTTESLPGFLRTQGFKTISISPFAERHSSWSFYAGFNEMHNTGKCGGESAEEVTPTVMKWIKNNAMEDNWFLQLNYWDAHIPYRVPEEYGNPFEGQPIPDWLTQETIDRHRKMTGQFSARESHVYNDTTDYPRYPGQIRNLEDFRKLIDGYDTGIRYMDEHVGKVLDEFDKMGILDDMVIIISADHGENLGELGIYPDHQVTDYATARIPMIFKWPGCKEQHVDEGLHYNLDLGPTIAELLDADPPEIWDGESYAKTITDGEDCGREYLVLSQCAHTCMRSVRFGPWLYMRFYHDCFRLYPREMLFNIEEDPHETANLAENRKDVSMQATYHLHEWHDDMMMSMDCDTDPLWTVMKEGGPYHARGTLKDYCERLEKTGREAKVEQLKKRYPQEFID